MPARPGAFRFSDPDYASKLAEDPLVTGGAVFGPEDLEKYRPLFEDIFTRPGTSEDELQQMSEFFKSMRANPGGRWRQLGEKWMWQTYEHIPKKLRVPGVVDYGESFGGLTDHFLTYINKKLEPLASMEWAHSLDPDPDFLEHFPHEKLAPAQIYTLGRSYNPAHGAAPQLATMRLLKTFADSLLPKATGLDKVRPVNPGIVSDYTGNLLHQMWDSVLKRGKKP